MKLKSLILLVLLIVGGTAASVRWYLQVEPQAKPARAMAGPASLPEYTPLPMRAEPARKASLGLRPGSWDGVASRGSAAARSESALEVAPAAPCGASSAVPGVFAPEDPL
jgi:hypothetical protein